MSVKPATGDRILAILGHLAALAQGLGLPLPAILWAEQRKNSPYISFQLLQAYVYQSLGYTVWILLSLLMGILAALLLGLLTSLGNVDAGLVDHVGFIITLGVFLPLVAYLLIALVGAVACGLGLDFRYPFIGSRLARYLGYDPALPDSLLDGEHEERIAVAMGHFSVIFTLYGLLAPAALWLTEGKRSVFVRFQSAQTVIFQAVGSVFYMGTAFLFLVLLFPLLLSLTVFDFSVTPVALFLALAGLCLLLFLALFGPLYHIFGQWAGLQILLGHDFRYPLIASLAARWAKTD